MGTEPGEDKYYHAIVMVVWIGFGVLCAALVLVNTKAVAAWSVDIFGERPALFIHLALWGALGGLLSGYKFVANDKERNELAALEEEPDPVELRYPTRVDVHLYGLRIVSSGALGVVSGLLVLTGLIYFQVETPDVPLRQRLFMILLAFVVGLHENNFLAFLLKLNQSVLSPHKPDATGQAT